MSGPIQSSDYVPGVSGWKIDDATGEFEINPARPSSSSEPQAITVTAGEWPEYDLPANAIERYAFIGAEVAKIPVERRGNAQFETKDFSFECDGSDVRTTLTYERPETPEEIFARMEKAKVAGARIVRAGGCTTAIIDGVVRWRLGDLSKPVGIEPFKVVDGVTYVSEAVIDGAAISNAKLTAQWSIRMQVNANGQHVAAGLGPAVPDSIGSQFLTSADAFAIKERSAQEVLDKISTVIGESSLTAGLESPIPGIVRDTIRAEMRPGGLLHRSR